MNPTVKNILAVIAGWIGGSAVNMTLIQVGHSVFPIEGINPEDLEALAEVMPTLDNEYFIFPFLAHALGTLVGAFIAAKVASNRKMTMAMIIGVLFLIGGIIVNTMLPGPTWFTAVDIALAYIPLAWVGGKLATGKAV